MLVDKLIAGAAGTIHRKGAVGEVISETGEGAIPGFGVLIGKERTYIVRFRVRGQPTQYTRRIGDIREIGLADARAEAVRVKGMAKGNKALKIPPRHPDQDEWDRQAAEEAAVEAAATAAATKMVEEVKAATRTFKAVAEAFLADTLDDGGFKLASKDELRRKLKTDLAGWNDVQIGEIDDIEIERVVRTKAQALRAKGEGRGAAANRLLSFIKQVFAYAKKRRMGISQNPALEVGKMVKEKPRDRYLSEPEIRIFWLACGKLPEPAGRLFRLCLVLGQRRGEIAGMRRSELEPIAYTDTDPATGRERDMECDGWSIPLERMKARKPHSLPLSRLAKRLIDGAEVLKDAEGEPFDHVLASGAAGDAAVSGWSKWRRLLDVAIAEVIAQEAGEEVDLGRHRFQKPFHIHDLRATLVSHMSKKPLRVPRDVISRLVAHAEGERGRSTTAGYDRSDRFDEALEALERWGERIETIVGENVLPFGDEKRA
ncbi:MAG: hypothetical protein WDM85_07815 [Caulobacteraceae bacterium]